MRLNASQKGKGEEVYIDSVEVKEKRKLKHPRMRFMDGLLGDEEVRFNLAEMLMQGWIEKP